MLYNKNVNSQKPWANHKNNVAASLLACVFIIAYVYDLTRILAHLVRTQAKACGYGLAAT